MNDKLKAAIFDAEQALTWARQAIDDGDKEATAEAISNAATAICVASAELQRPTDN